MRGIYEYSGKQRCGKSTKMVADYDMKLRPLFGPEDVLANFRIFIDGVTCLETADLIEAVMELKRKKIRHKVIMFDEVGQFMIARNYANKQQTEFVNFAWQMPKRDIILLYASNIGNSADIILRDATWVTVLPHYKFGPTREEDTIHCDVIFNYELRVKRGIVLRNIPYYQSLFNSDEPIE